MNHKISVIMPAFNNESSIDEAIVSVLGQTYKNLELIIINDGSSDATANIIKKYVEKDNRVKYLFQQNSGQGKARNLGINNCSGGLVAFLDADDIWLPEKLEEQVALFDDENIGLVYCDAENFGPDAPAVKIRSLTLGHFSGNVTRELIKKNFITNSTVIVRKNILNISGLFNESKIIRAVEDYDLWLRISVICKIKYLNKNLVRYRYVQKVSTRRDKGINYKKVSIVYFGILRNKNFLRYFWLVVFKAIIYYCAFVFYYFGI